MARKTYEIRVRGEKTPRLLISADLVRAEQPIRYCVPEMEEEGGWTSTPYQTADARHRESEMATLCRGQGSEASWDEDDEIEIVVREER